jgi:hypothetical protein
MSKNIEIATGQVPESIGSTNRGHDTVFEGQLLTVTLEKINEILISHLRDTIIPTVDDNGISRAVPILYGDGERWAHVRKEGHLRDSGSDKLLAPLIMIRRVSAKPGKLNNPNNKYNYQTWTTGWNKRNVYDKFAVQNRIIPSQEVRDIIIPDYMDLEYEVIMWTEKQQQMDTLIEQINVENYEFWGNRNNFKFRVNINDGFQGKSELPPSDNRVVRTQFSMTIAAYLLPERAVNNYKIAATSRTRFTNKKVVVKEEVVNDVKNLET